ncbi:MAG TPA: hypothetical protein VFV23_14520 [Verrucomicrobiae bacterium]|nr:hypothetical protein [Verrucomicrobiae bacterium]
MDFIKKNYEKVILGAVLLGLLGVLVMMWFVIQADRDKMQQFANLIFNTRTTPLPDLDMAAEQKSVLRLKSPLHLDLDTTNKLFNPVEWQRAVDGRLVKAERLGAKAAVVADITPLYLIISLNSIETNELGARYSIAVERQNALIPSQRRPQRYYISKGEKNNLFTLLNVQGPADNPTALVLKLADSGETISISREKEYRRVEGYEADIKYDPEKRTFNNRRVGSVLSFGGEDYIIVAIDKDEVILSAQSNLKKYTLPYTP